MLTITWYSSYKGLYDEPGCGTSTEGNTDDFVVRWEGG